MHYRNGREAKNGDKIVKLAVACLTTVTASVHVCATASTLTTWPPC
jgi:hypothetical protein